MGDAVSTEQRGQGRQEAGRRGKSGLALTVGDQPCTPQQSCSLQLCKGTRHREARGLLRASVWGQPSHELIQ